MPRFAKANQTIDDLKNTFTKIADELGIDSWKADSGSEFIREVFENLPNIRADISNVCTFETSNSAWANKRYENLPGLKLKKFEVLNGIPVAWCASAGDCSAAVIYVLYIGEDGELHGHFPSDGNYYDKKMKYAWEAWNGNEVDDDGDLIALGGNPRKYDVNKLREDVKNNVLVR